MGYTLHQRNPTMSRHPLDKGGKMKGYIAFYKGKQMEVKAISALSAREIAAEKFRARKPYDVEVVLAEKDGKQVTHMPMFASEETPMTLAHILESEGLKTAARPYPEFTVQGYKGFTDQIRDLDVLHTEAMELKAEIDSAVAPLLERKGKLDKEMKKIHETIKADYKDSLDKIGNITIERKTQLVEAAAQVKVVERRGSVSQVNAKLLQAVIDEYGDEVAAFIQTTQEALRDSNKTMAISFKGFEIERKADVKAASEKSAGLADLLSKFQDYLRKSWKRVVAVAKNALGMVESASGKVEKAHGNLEKALAQVERGGRSAMDLTARSGLGRGEIKNLTYRVLLPALKGAGKSGPEMGYILIEAGELFNKEARAMFGPPSGKVGGSKASDRTTLIRMASELPKGSDERRAILAGLQIKSAAYPFGMRKRKKWFSGDGETTRLGENWEEQ